MFKPNIDSNFQWNVFQSIALRSQIFLCVWEITPSRCEWVKTQHYFKDIVSSLLHALITNGWRPAVYDVSKVTNLFKFTN